VALGLGGAAAAILACLLVMLPTKRVAQGSVVSIDVQVALINVEERESGPLDYVVDGLKLKLMSPLKRSSDIPTAGRGEVIVAEVRNILYFRIFDADAQRIIDADETGLAHKTEEVAKLRARLEDLWEAQEWPPGVQSGVVADVMSLVGRKRAGGQVIAEIARWPTFPNCVVVEPTSVVAEPALIEWYHFERGHHVTPGLWLRLRGKLRIPDDCPLGPGLLALALPKRADTAGNSHPPRLLNIDRLDDPNLAFGDYRWPVLQFTVHDTHREAALAHAYDIARTALIGGAIVLAAAIAYRTLKL